MAISTPAHDAHQPAKEVVSLTPEEITDLFYHASTNELIGMSSKVCLHVHGRAILLRGLIEFTNFCRNDCLYCGIRHGNRKTNRYRMAEETILEVIQEGYYRGIRSFVLQGGEDPDYPTDRICRLVRRIKEQCSDAAITLSCGIRSNEDYCAMVTAGADRYLLRFETGDAHLHLALRKCPLEDRLAALAGIRQAGFQVGSGFMLGLPGECAEIRLANILLCRLLQLDMVGVGPFIPHPDTPLRQARQHPLEDVIRSVALLRLALPLAHIPATTAAGTLQADGREQMIAAGANVLMPNLTPMEYKRNYLLYPKKVCLLEKGLHDLERLDVQIRGLDRQLSFARGDALRLERTSK